MLLATGGLSELKWRVPWLRLRKHAHASVRHGTLFCLLFCIYFDLLQLQAPTASGPLQIEAYGPFNWSTQLWWTTSNWAHWHLRSSASLESNIVYKCIFKQFCRKCKQKLGRYKSWKNARFYVENALMAIIRDEITNEEKAIMLSSTWKYSINSSCIFQDKLRSRPDDWD